jgi:hypothetical protein
MRRVISGAIEALFNKSLVPSSCRNAGTCGTARSLCFIDMEQFLIEQRIPFKLLAKKQGFDIQKNWLDIFAKKVKEKIGKFQVGEFVWENFNDELQPALYGSKAIEEYRKCEAEPIYIFDEGCRHCYLCKVSVLPEFIARSGDIYVFPVSKRWTMEYSHMGDAYFLWNET